MKNKNGDGLPSVRKEQLFSEKAFIRHCIYDYHQNRKLDDINESFLRAAESDGFLEPLLQVEEDAVQEDGSKKKALVNYYSPHQIFIIASLSKNKVHEGHLWTHHDFDWYIKQKTRYVEWGWSGYAFNVDYAKSGIKHHSELNIFDLCKDFHNFLRLLHSLNNDRYGGFDRNKERYFNDAPSINFDFSSLTKEVLDEFTLNTDRLRMLRKHIGSFALQIDPFETWYFYIKRHPRWKKDSFKGDALLAQEIYIISDLITEAIEKLLGEKEPDLLSSVHEKFYPTLLPRDEYATGSDVKALWGTIANFRQWAAINKDLVPAGMLQRLAEFEKELKAYEEKYGDKSYVSGISRPVEYEEKLGINDLDPSVAHYVTQFLKQIPKVDQDELKMEIASAISWRLHDLERKLWQVLDEAGDVLRKKVDEAWNIEHDFSNHFWFKRKDELSKLSREGQMKLYDTEYQKAYKEATSWSNKRDEFAKTISHINLIYCQNCRNKPVKVRSDRGDQLFYDTFICEDCLKAMDEPRMTNLAVWNCMYCGRVLYKFNYENRINDLLINKATSDMVLEYGRLKLVVRCGNRECGKINERWIDWGWTA